MTTDYEVRSFHTNLRAVTGEDDQPIIEGISPVFNREADIGGMFIEVIDPSVAKDLQSFDVRARYNHDLVLGRTKNGTLKLEARADGIHYSIFVNRNDALAMAAYEKVKRGDVDGASFAFTVPPDGEVWTRSKGVITRRVTKFDMLLDVGPVDFPAYDAASAQARSKYQQLQEQEPQAASGDADAKAQARRRHLQLLSLNQPKE